MSLLQTSVNLLLSSNEIRLGLWWKKCQNSESSHFPSLNYILQMGPEQKYGLTLAGKMTRINTFLEKTNNLIIQQT